MALSNFMFAQPSQNNFPVAQLDARCSVAPPRLDYSIGMYRKSIVFSRDVNPTCCFPIFLQRENDGHHSFVTSPQPCGFSGVVHETDDSGRRPDRSNANLTYMRFACHLVMHLVRVIFFKLKDI